MQGGPPDHWGRLHGHSEHSHACTDQKRLGPFKQRHVITLSKLRRGRRRHRRNVWWVFVSQRSPPQPSPSGEPTTPSAPKGSPLCPPRQGAPTPARQGRGRRTPPTTHTNATCSQRPTAVTGSAGPTRRQTRLISFRIWPTVGDRKRQPALREDKIL